MCWFAVNWDIGRSTFASRRTHRARNVAASCRQGLALWRQSRSRHRASRERSGAERHGPTPIPVVAFGTALGLLLDAANNLAYAPRGGQLIRAAVHTVDDADLFRTDLEALHECAYELAL